MECDVVCSGSSAPTFMRYRLPKSLLRLLRMMLEARVSSETSAKSHVPTGRYIPEDRVCHGHPCENLKPYILQISLLCCGLFLFSKYCSICRKYDHVFPILLFVLILPVTISVFQSTTECLLRRTICNNHL
jgi:hypothetical protein